MKIAHRSDMKTDSNTKTRVQSQRDCVLQPRVVRNELPWEISPAIHNPNGVAATHVVPLACAATLSGLKILQTHFPRELAARNPGLCVGIPLGFALVPPLGPFLRVFHLSISSPSNHMKTELNDFDPAAPATLLRREIHPKATTPADTEHAPPNTIDFRSSDATLDRYQEVITVAGWKLDSYRKNPVVQNAHNYCSLAATTGKPLTPEIRSPSPARASTPLSRPTGEGQGEGMMGAGQGEGPASPRPSDGRGIKGEGRAGGQGDGPYLFQRIQFAVDENPMARVAYGLYKGGFLNAVSVGFIPIRGDNGSQEKAYRRKFLEQELLEVSAVSIPANPNAHPWPEGRGNSEKRRKGTLPTLEEFLWGEARDTNFTNCREFGGRDS